MLSLGVRRQRYLSISPWQADTGTQIWPIPQSSIWSPAGLRAQKCSEGRARDRDIIWESPGDEHSSRPPALLHPIIFCCVGARGPQQNGVCFSAPRRGEILTAPSRRSAYEELQNCCSPLGKSWLFQDLHLHSSPPPSEKKGCNICRTYTSVVVDVHKLLSL